MSNFPSDFDDDTTLPIVNDNIADIGGEAINALRDAVFEIEQNIGLDAAGTVGSVSARLNIAFFPDGTLKPSAITSLGLVTLPITDNQISETAQITESKLLLDHRTQDLFNYITDLSNNVKNAQGWISATGVKLEPHLSGTIYKHTLHQIDVTTNINEYLKNKFNNLRSNSDSYLLINDLNQEFLDHQWADGSAFTAANSIYTFNGSVYPATYAHTASGIYLNTSRFSTIPQTAQDLQQFAEFIDSSSIFLYGTRIQNLYTNGISRVSRASSLSTDGYGAPIIPSTPAIAYLLNTGNSSSSVDDINHGDDIIEFKPSQADQDSNSFDQKFALVKIGDIIRINYGSVEVPFVIKEKKYIQDSGNKKYLVRIVGKNLSYNANASARIDKPLYNGNKFGVLSMAAANNNFAPVTPSLIIGTPRGAQILGVGFNPDQFDSNHYLLYLAIYPTGNPQDGYTILPSIDVTGNKGATPGKYTLDYVVEATNNAFRQTGYNYRFTAFSYQGEFGIMLADSYSNTAFSILSAVVSSDGTYDSLGTTVSFPNNVVGIFSTSFLVAPDPLGFGPSAANVASPPYMSSYGSAEASQNPTKLFVPLKRQNYYVNGIEREKMAIESGQVLDGYGDGYWVGYILTPPNVIPGPVPSGRVNTTYRVLKNLQDSNLKEGKTIVIQSLGQGKLVDFGRFIIQSITYGCGPDNFTDIEVYDAVHGAGLSPTNTLGVGGTVAIYFSSDSVSFNKETATDTVNVTPFKRHFEVYVDQDGKTFTHERGRFNASSSTLTINGSIPLLTFSELTKLDIIKISPKLRGYQFGSVTKISLHMLDYDDVTGFFDGYLSSYDGSVFTHKGPIVNGKKGEVTRFYDETNIDYIDILFDINTSVSSFNSTPSSVKILDFQLFPTLSLDQEILLIGTCQLNDVTNSITKLRDERQFGNTSEKDFSTSALEFLSLPEKVLHGNGVIRGFDIADRGLDADTLIQMSNPEDGQVFLTGGLALVNGKFVQANNETVIIPIIKESYGSLYNVNWVLCINDKKEYNIIPLLDYDSALGTPNNSSRVFKAFNLVNGVSYYLDAVTFSDLVNNRKDLTPLYIVAATTTPGSGPVQPYITLEITDARKYVNDVDSNLPLRLTSSVAQGNFRNPVSIFNWIKYNNTFNSTAFVKGADVDSGAINTDIILDFNSTAIIDGENDATLTMNGLVTIGSNLIIQNLNIIFNGGISVKDGAKNLMFKNCSITIQVPEISPTDNVIFNFVNGNNIVIEDCDISVQYNSLYDSNSVIRGAIFKLTDTTDFKFLNSNIGAVSNDNIFLIQAGTVTPGNIFELYNSSGAIIEDSNFSGNFNKFIHIDDSNDLELNNLQIVSTYNPYAGGTPDSYNGVSYNSANLVNSGQGWIYSNVTRTLDNINIRNTTFNYNPSTLAGAANRYSVINFELSSNNSILNNLNISNCRFNNLMSVGSDDDIRPAIAIINTAAATTASGQQPIVTGLNIDNNICNKNQSIIVTSKVDSNSRMVYPGLTTISSIIRNNTCGTIGYWVSSGSKTIGLSPNVNSLSDKTGGLIIDNNTCHYLANLDSTGSYFQVCKIVSSVTANMCDYPSGHVVIKNNKTNWIHSGISFEESSSLHILNNTLDAYYETYMDQFGDATTTIDGYGHGYAILVTTNKPVFANTYTFALGEGEGVDAACVISGNTTSPGYWLQTTLTTSILNYSSGYIYCQSSNIIKNNILRGIADNAVSGFSTSAILVTGLNNHISENKIYRNGKSISAYVKFANINVPAWDGSGSTGVITDNYFDSPYINDSTLSESVISILPNAINNWIYERNKNQTGTAAISPTNQFVFSGGYGWGPMPSNTNMFVTTMSDSVGNQLTGLPWGGYRSQSTLIVEQSPQAAADRFWYAQENLEKYLPNNVRVISISGGLRPYETVVNYSTSAVPSPILNPVSSNFWTTISSLNPNIDYTNTNTFASSSSSDSTILELNSPVFSVVTGGQVNATGLNIPYSINLEDYKGSDISYTYITGRGKGITISWIWVWYRTSATMHVTVSPLRVKYRW